MNLYLLRTVPIFAKLIFLYSIHFSETNEVIQSEESETEPSCDRVWENNMAARPLPVPVENEPFYMNIDRNEAESMLIGQADGTFILRPSSQVILYFSKVIYNFIVYMYSNSSNFFYFYLQKWHCSPNSDKFSLNCLLVNNYINVIEWLYSVPHTQKSSEIEPATIAFQVIRCSISLRLSVKDYM